MGESNRKKFREECKERHNGVCAVPWCEKSMDDAHHIIEREEWKDGGYHTQNGVAVCNHHHRTGAETNQIPPHAFWLWNGIREESESFENLRALDDIRDPSAESHTPDKYDTIHINKWGKSLEIPPQTGVREVDKYPSTPHLLPLYWHDSESTAESRTERDDTGVQSLEHLVGVPLVVLEKMDGGNCLVVNDMETPVRARNGTTPEDTMRPFYREDGPYWTQKVNQKLPDRLQVFGEWMWAKHSIHYGCNCDTECDDVAPSLSELTGVTDKRAYFQIFGAYDKHLKMWLSWPTTKQIASTLGFPTTPILYEEGHSDEATFESEHEARRELTNYARDVISRGGEGIVVRSKYPYHYGQFSSRIGKFVRENHVNTDTHWSHREVVKNEL